MEASPGPSSELVPEGMDDGDPRSSILDPRLQVVFVDRDLPMIEQQSSENPTTQIALTISRT